MAPNFECKKCEVYWFDKFTQSKCWVCGQFGKKRLVATWPQAMAQAFEAVF